MRPSSLRLQSISIRDRILTLSARMIGQADRVRVITCQNSLLPRITKVQVTGVQYTVNEKVRKTLSKLNFLAIWHTNSHVVSNQPATTVSLNVFGATRKVKSSYREYNDLFQRTEKGTGLRCTAQELHTMQRSFGSHALYYFFIDDFLTHVELWAVAQL